MFLVDENLLIFNAIFTLVQQDRKRVIPIYSDNITLFFLSIMIPIYSADNNHTKESSIHDFYSHQIKLNQLWL